MSDIDLCLNCQLWTCDDTSKECAFVQIKRDRTKEKKKQKRNSLTPTERLKDDIVAILRKLKKSRYDRERYQARKWS